MSNKKLMVVFGISIAILIAGAIVSGLFDFNHEGRIDTLETDVTAAKTKLTEVENAVKKENLKPTITEIVNARLDDKKVQDSFRGAEGKRGPEGSQGPKGAKGDPGKQGTAGICDDSQCSSKAVVTVKGRPAVKKPAKRSKPKRKARKSNRRAQQRPATVPATGMPMIVNQNNLIINSNGSPVHVKGTSRSVGGTFIGPDGAGTFFSNQNTHDIVIK